MLGLAPDTRGLIPEADAARLWEFGAAIRRIYGVNLARTANTAAAPAADGDPDTFWSAPAGAHAASIILAFPMPERFDRAVVTEYLPGGQHVHKYRLEVPEGRGWKTLAAGATIGHKKIDIFPAVTAARVRLNILSASDAPKIREFQLYDGGRAGPPTGSRGNPGR